jgi:hypothetical protein
MDPKKPGGIGYGRPPKEHKFQKGQSGNKKGRPPQPKVSDPDQLNIEAIFERTARTSVTIETNGIVRQIPFMDALCHQIASAALSDTRVALKVLPIFMEMETRRASKAIPKDDVDAQEIFSDPIVQRAIAREIRRRLQEDGQGQAAAKIMDEEFGSGDEDEREEPEPVEDEAPAGEP